MAGLVSVDDFNRTSAAPAVFKAAADNFNKSQVQQQTPSAPPSFVAAPLDQGAHLSWAASTGTVTGYRITATAGTLTYTFTTSSSTLAADVTGLTNTVLWTFTIVALNGTIVGPASTSTATPTFASGPPTGDFPILVAVITVPNAPVLNTLIASDGAIQAFWTAPAYDGGAPVTSYMITASFGGETHTQIVTGAVVGTVGLLTNGTTYNVTVSATNSRGKSAESNIRTATPVLGGPPVDPPPTPPPPASEAPRVPTVAPSIVAFDPQTPFAPAFWRGI